MEKWGSKWLEMHSQRHRFLTKSGGGPPYPPRMSGGVHPPSHTLPPLMACAARFMPSGSSPDHCLFDMILFFGIY